MFGGIGSAIVALKRLKIAMCTVVHVEHDKVARHVYKWNHDYSYWSNLKKSAHSAGSNNNTSTINDEHYYDDGIEHLYCPSFEKFVERFKKGKYPCTLLPCWLTLLYQKVIS